MSLALLSFSAFPSPAFPHELKQHEFLIRPSYTASDYPVMTPNKVLPFSSLRRSGITTESGQYSFFVTGSFFVVPAEQELSMYQAEAVLELAEIFLLCFPSAWCSPPFCWLLICLHSPSFSFLHGYEPSHSANLWYSDKRKEPSISFLQTMWVCKCHGTHVEVKGHSV